MSIFGKEFGASFYRFGNKQQKRQANPENSTKIQSWQKHLNQVWKLFAEKQINHLAKDNYLAVNII